MRKLLVSLLVLVTVAVPRMVLAQSASRFVGSWVEDQSKRTIGSLRNLTFRTAGGGLEELRGSYANPLAQPVRFDGKPVQVDGSKNTIVWKQLDATHFERVISQNSQVINTRRLALSADGTTLTEATDSMAAGKKSVSTIVYRRTSGTGTTLAGVWKPQSFKSDTPATLRIESAGPSLRVFINEKSSGFSTNVLSFDGKSSPVEGPAVITGTARAGKLVSDNSIEISVSRAGVATGRDVWTLSADGRTLTTSQTNVGPDSTGAPSVTVYTKQ